MQQTTTLLSKGKMLLYILLPILITQIGLYSMNFFDTVMSGHSSPNDLAGVAIGSSIWVPIFTGLNGILLSITPIVAHYIGAKELKKVPFTVTQGIYLSVALAILIVILGAFLLDPILNGMNLEPDVHMIAKHYLIALSFGIIPLFIYTVLRCFMDALGQTRVTMFITLTSLPINVVFNYLLIFGKFGFPHLGGVGAGVASAITYWCILLLAGHIVHRNQPFKEFRVFYQFTKLSLQAWKEQLKIGVPIGFAIFFETSIFAAVTLLMSQYNTLTIAAHQAAMNFASLLYMIPLSISMALTITVGFEAGAKRQKDATQYSYLGIGIAVTMSAICAVILFIFNERIASLYTTDPKVLSLTAHFLIYAIFFQLSDAVAAPIQGALRGYKDVNITLILALVSYWVVGLPLGYYLANQTGLAAFGYWIGLITGLAVGAILLFSRLRFIQKQGYKAQAEL